MIKVLLLMQAITVGVVSLQAANVNDMVFAESIPVSAVTSVYDGDTFRVNLPDEWPKLVGYHMPVRVAHIDTPEMKGECQEEIDLAREAKQATVAMLRAGKIVELRNVRRGKYFRVIAEVFVDGKSLGDELLRRGLAVRYEGGHKSKEWCEK